MQKWEYLYIKRERGFDTPLTDVPRPTKWTSKIYTSEGEKAYNFVTLNETLKILGEDGWELISVSPISSIIGDVFSGFTDQVF
jgi:hypothetical protein